ncbi:hypothetical protein BD779DRAFT_607898 [Infundibulicybe gibba]|nr:hypothetical protein BD779DRAFT_607898 [Infundibulicybe gibba]
MTSMFSSVGSSMMPNQRHTGPQKNYPTQVPRSFSVRVFKAPSTLPYAANGKFDTNTRPGVPQPQKWFSSVPESAPGLFSAPSGQDASRYLRNSTLSGDVRGYEAAPPRASSYSIYQGLSKDTYIYERSLSSKSDIFSVSDFDSISTTTFSPAMSTDSTLTLKSPGVFESHLEGQSTHAEPLLRAQSAMGGISNHVFHEDHTSHPMGAFVPHAASIRSSAHSNIDSRFRTEPAYQGRLQSGSSNHDTPSNDRTAYPRNGAVESDSDFDRLARLNTVLNAASSTSISLSRSDATGADSQTRSSPPTTSRVEGADPGITRIFPNLPLRSSPEQEPLSWGNRPGEGNASGANIRSTVDRSELDQPDYYLSSSSPELAAENAHVQSTGERREPAQDNRARPQRDFSGRERARVSIAVAQSVSVLGGEPYYTPSTEVSSGKVPDPQYINTSISRQPSSFGVHNQNASGTRTYMEEEIDDSYYTFPPTEQTSRSQTAPISNHSERFRESTPDMTGIGSGNRPPSSTNPRSAIPERSVESRQGNRTSPPSSGRVTTNPPREQSAQEMVSRAIPIMAADAERHPSRFTHRTSSPPREPRSGPADQAEPSSAPTRSSSTTQAYPAEKLAREVSQMSVSRSPPRHPHGGPGRTRKNSHSQRTHLSPPDGARGHQPDMPQDVSRGPLPNIKSNSPTLREAVSRDPYITNDQEGNGAMSQRPTNRQMNQHSEPQQAPKRPSKEQQPPIIAGTSRIEALSNNAGGISAVEIPQANPPQGPRSHTPIPETRVRFATPQRRHSDGDQQSSDEIPHGPEMFDPAAGNREASYTNRSHSTPPIEPQRRYSDGDQMPTHRHPMARTVRWHDNLICPSPIFPSQRRKGWFNRRGDQLWTNDGAYRPSPLGHEYPIDLDDYRSTGKVG